MKKERIIFPTFDLPRYWQQFVGGVSTGIIAATLPFLDENLRSEIFDEKKNASPLERIYARAFKEATGSGERSRGAHLRALEAVHRAGFETRAAHPIRSFAADLLQWTRDCVIPK